MVIMLNKIVVNLFKIIIKFYQICFSPFFGKQCRFHPSCSIYASLAISRHGSLKGIYLTLKRLFNCHPFGGSGYDPVPK